MGHVLTTEGQISLLSKGMNFSVVPKRIPSTDIVAKVEQAIKAFPKDEADTIRAKVSLTIQNTKSPKDNLDKPERIALNELRKDDSIIILPADKGRATVILNKDDYHQKCLDHIENGPYKILKRDPSRGIKESIRKKLQSLKDNCHIDDKLYFKLKPTDAPMPRFYGLPKIHKDNIPIRPIVSYSGTPLYRLSNHVADILKTYTSSDHCKNSKEFSEYIRNIRIEDDEVMVSFDVTSLYTNVPISDTLNIINNLINADQQFSTKTKIPPVDFMQLVESVLTKTWFSYNNKIYTQTDGVAMGGPASSVVAEIYMQFHEKNALSTSQQPPKIWQRYVDDVFAIIKTTNLETFFNHLNSQHPNIKFTLEQEKDQKIAFLDTLIVRNNNKIKVQIYRKPTHTDQYLDFNSNHQLAAKESVISSLLSRAEHVVSDPEDKSRELHYITNVLMANNYTQSAISKVKRKLNTERVPVVEDDNEEYKGFINLPYIKNTSENLRRIFNQHKIRCTFYSSETLRKRLSHPKDKIAKDNQNNIIYRIPCQDCDAVYIGESKRSLKQRSTEHARAVKNGDVTKNEIADHCWKFDHKFNWDEKRIVDKEQDWTSRKVKETIHSLNEKKHINSISYTLPDIWLPILRKTEN